MGKLINKLNEYGNSDIYAFHMPGHKRMPDVELNPYKADITEIDGFDDLHKPEDILFELKNKIAKIYNADEAYILLNGSTSGIQTAISGATEYGDHILIARNCHKSVYNTVMLRGLKISCIFPQIDEVTGINQAVNPEDVDNMLKQNKDIKAVVITSPTYEGIVSDINSISDIVHKYGIPMIVDCAHGAHLGFCDFFPDNPLNEGADIVIMSLHKTLPSLTQTAVMCIKGNIVNRNKIERYFHAYLSSSPSYVLMASVEKCLDYIEKEIVFTEYSEKLKSFYNSCNLRKLGLYKTDDPGKIVVTTAKTNLNGELLKKILRDKYLIEVEMSSRDYIIAMTSVCDTEEGFERLCNALMEIDKDCIEVSQNNFNQIVIPEVAIGIYEAEKQAKKTIKLEECAGKTSAGFVFAYPPGIPIIAPGEIFSQKIIKIIEENLKADINIYGVSTDKMVSICDIEG